MEWDQAQRELQRLHADLRNLRVAVEAGAPKFELLRPLDDARDHARLLTDIFIDGKPMA